MNVYNFIWLYSWLNNSSHRWNRVTNLSLQSHNNVAQTLGCGHQISFSSKSVIKLVPFFRHSVRFREECNTTASETDIWIVPQFYIYIEFRI